MAFLSVLLVLIACVVPQTWGLQVAPNSACSSVCLDDPSQDVSDPNVSNTNGSDIVCNDDDYQNTAVGSKFKQCISCLQNSTASDSGETDTEWFLYNIRYAFDTCIFGYANATHPISTPCSTDTVCAPLQPALEASMGSPSSGTQYAYCSADNNLFLSSALQPCVSCFKQTDNEAYFANFLVALQGGCVQQPKVGSLIGLDGTLFSSIPVNITSPITPGAKSHKTLSIGAIIGIAVGGVALMVIVASVTFVCVRKHRDRRRISRYVSKLDERHGNRNISVPTQGAYAAPLAPLAPSGPGSTPWEDLALQKMQVPTYNPEPKSKATFLGKENYRAADQHYERQKTRQQQQASAQGLGFIDIAHSRSYSPERDTFAEPPAPAYTPPSRSPSERLPDLPMPPVSSPPVSSPAVSSPPVPSPSGSGRGNMIRTTTFVPYYNSNPVSPIEPSPNSSPPISGSTAKRSSATTISTTRSSKKSPIIGSGLPKEPSPRSHTFNNPGRQRYHSRDLSAGRGSISMVPFESGSTSAPLSISGPMVSAGSRFTEEEETNRRESLRARAYDQGLGGWKDPWNENAIKERDSEDSDDSGPEMWPGSY